jgi:hypothetical protein
MVVEISRSNNNYITAKLNPSREFIWFYKDHPGSVRHLSIDEMVHNYFPYGCTRYSNGDETAYRFSRKEFHF